MFTFRIARLRFDVLKTGTRSALAVALLAVCALAPAGLLAAPPAGYYDSVNPSTPQTLRTTLHVRIHNHTKIPYTSSSTDTWDVLNAADQDAANAANILDIYKNASYLKISGGTGAYNREHVWPNSYGFSSDGSTNFPYTDCHHLFLSDTNYNNNRGNLPFGTCSAAATERPTDVNGGQGGGSGVYPGNSNWYNGSAWQMWSGRQGDAARALLYMDVRYEGGINDNTGTAEPDLILTDNASLIQTTGGNASVAYMGLLSVLLQWSAADPVDDKERARNDVVYSYQHNRNPFIDHPEWVNALFLPSTGPTIDAVADVPGDQGGELQVSWQRNTLDAAGATVPITQYVVQRYAGSAWVDVAVQPANHSATYSLTIPTSDIASPANPQPWSQYRVEAIETGGLPHTSPAVGGYSLDNLAPPTPVVSLDTSATPWVISWSAPAIPDFNAACVYRGETSGFTPATPLQCDAGTSYLEYDTSPHFYVVQFSDTHGNLSGFSAEVSPNVTGVPPANGPLTAITRIYPNPFNPRTRVAFSLREPGAVSLDLFAADGRFVRSLLNGSRAAGAHEVLWDGIDSRGGRAPSGLYFLRLHSGGQTDTQKLLLVK